ncbi:hypothetical protein BM525_19010 (plasmid) [Alteromonas mediterranea]|uniref:Uncharacterized protein n=1 Tax=Alteromonas mediterranea TaxID=314275 RepID=A0AAC9JEB6_9ALTE|nr:hypothetical protein [Alteromonas mediterranea]APD91974.1 hypothetical protein BM524_18815 [Alteromonas mediterranea]APD99828.1 hypothetical protein BM525_19010 [Alteromonas mediterranea]
MSGIYYNSGDKAAVSEFVTILKHMALCPKYGVTVEPTKRGSGVNYLLRIYQYQITFLATIEDSNLIKAMDEAIAWNKANLMVHIDEMELTSHQLQLAKEKFIQEKTQALIAKSNPSITLMDAQARFSQEAEAFFSKENEALANITNKVFLNAYNKHPNQYFKEIGISQTF